MTDVLIRPEEGIARQLTEEQMMQYGQATLWVIENQRLGETRYPDFLHLYVGDPREENEPRPEVWRLTEKYGWVEYDRVAEEWWTDEGKAIQWRIASRVGSSTDSVAPPEESFVVLNDLDAGVTLEWVGPEVIRANNTTIILPARKGEEAVALTTGIASRDAITRKKQEARHAQPYRLELDTQRGLYLINPNGRKEVLYAGMLGLMEEVETAEIHRQLFGAVLEHSESRAA